MATMFVHTADLHLRQDQPVRMEILSWIVAYCQQSSANLIIAGDLFDSNLDAALLRPRVRHILREVPGSVILIAGNHDADSYGEDVEYGSNVIVLRPNCPYIDVDGVRIAGVPFVPDTKFSDYAQNLSELHKVDILIAHGTFYDRRSSAVYLELGEDARYMPIYPWDVEGKARYIALGHYHSRYSHFAVGVTDVVYPGSPVATSTRSVGQRHIGVITSEGSQLRHHKKLIDIAEYWEHREWMVIPGREEQLLVAVEQDLAALAGPRVMLNGRVTGSVCMSETELDSRLKVLEDRYRSNYRALRITQLVKHWNQLLRSPTLRLFVQKLSQSGANTKTKDRALELVLSAIERIRR